MREIVQTTGPTFEQRLLGFRGIDTVDPINVEAVLSTHFSDFGLGERRLVFAPLLGQGIFTQDGKPWAHSRALLKPAFSRQDQSMAQIAEVTDQLLNLIPVSGSFIDDENTFAIAFDKGQDYLAQSGRLGGLHWLIDSSDFRIQCKRVHEHVDNAIMQVLQEQDTGDKQSTQSILQDLVQQSTEKKVLREQCLNVLLAGRDTTACLLSWTFRLLAKHSAVFNRCREDILNSCGFSGQITRQKIKYHMDDLPLKVLRLYPSVPINSRTATHTTTLPTGGGPNGTAPILVRKGEAVGYCPYIMHRRQETFGPDAEAFRPERWLENGSQAGYVVARMLQKFSSLRLPKEEPMEAIGTEKQKLTLVMCSAIGCNVVLT
ncbi:cytochrome P450 [Paraphaeosphaeria sporulosa]